MALTGALITTPYTTAARVARWLPNEYLTDQEEGDGPSDQTGFVSPDDVADLINTRSREIDGLLDDAGLRVPFPSILDAGTLLPAEVTKAVSMMVAIDIRAIIKYGEHGSENSDELDKRVKEFVARIKKNPHTIGRIAVTTVEDFRRQATPANPAGLLEAGVYRTVNRDVIASSVRFVNASGQEVLRSTGRPFRHGVDWKMISGAQGTFCFLNSTALSELGAGGGIVYEWSFVRLDRMTYGVTRLSGVPR